jgi:predicted RNA-binding Zn-ribbon protein involved in translation (DUF1610 family)
MREAGAILTDGQQTATTLQCPHCGKHWIMRSGSGRLRGFCLKCMRVTCGAPECMACVPIEARLDHAEGRKTAYDDTIRQLTAQGATLL